MRGGYVLSAPRSEEPKLSLRTETHVRRRFWRLSKVALYVYGYSRYGRELRAGRYGRERYTKPPYLAVCIGLLHHARNIRAKDLQQGS